MLVLTRLVDEVIMIGDDVEVVVVDIRGDKVRLGIRARTDIPVHRKEVYDAIIQEQRTKEQRTAEQRAAAPPAPIAARRPKRARRDDGRSGDCRSGG